jgi:hypothetical protein
VVTIELFVRDWIARKKAKQKAIAEAEANDTTGWDTVNDMLTTEKMYIQDYRLRNIYFPQYSKIVFI